MIDKTKLHQLRDQGLTYSQIGKEMGVSQQRISQIMLGNPVTPKQYQYQKEYRRHKHHKDVPQSYLRKPCKWCSSDGGYINV